MGSDDSRARARAGRVRGTEVGESLSLPPLRALLTEVGERIEAVVGNARQQMDALLDAVLAVSSGLELDATLRQIVQAAIDLVGARYAAMGVVDDDGTLSRFVQVGIDRQTEQLLGRPPRGHGVLGAVLEDEKPLRLRDLTKHPEFRGFPPNHPPMRSFLGVQVHARGEVFGRLYLTEKVAGPEFTDHDEIVVQALAGAAGVAIDNARLYESSRRRQRWLEASAEVGAALLGGTDTDEALQLIADRALELAGADHTLIALPADTDSEADDLTALRVTAAAGSEAPSLIGRRVPVGGSTIGRVFVERVPRSVPRLEFSLSPGFGPALAAPLASPDEIRGVLLAIRAAGAPEFDDDDVQVTASFADQAAFALQRAEIQRAQRELEVLEDRDRIARDLHDHVIQRLFAIGLAMQGTQRRAKSDPVAARLTDHIDQLHEVIQEIRSAIFDLQAAPTARPGLRSMLHGLIDELTADAPLRVTVRMSGPIDVVSDELAQHARAVVREAVSNAVRHAHAADLTVTVAVQDDLVIVVTDSGKGMPADVTPSGLRNLAERAAASGGTFEATAPPGGGTRVSWTAPLP